MSLYTPY